MRGYTASRILGQLGYKVKNLTGGYKSYVMSNYKPRKNKSSDPSVTSSTPSPNIKQNQKDTQKDTQNETIDILAQNAGTTNIDVVTLDACGLSCPGPLMQVKNQMDRLQQDQMLKVMASDPGFYEDIKAWATMTSNTLVERTKRSDGIIEAMLRKGIADNKDNTNLNSNVSSSVDADSFRQASSPDKNGSTMVVFSGDLDKAIASFIIANGAASSGKKVTMFFTFWGLNVIRKADKVKVNKSWMGKMFEMMMPRGSGKLPLSKLNMAGMGPKMIRSLMKKHQVFSLEELIQSAQKQGVEMIACQMSMDLMGIQREELIEGINIGGVGYYLGQTENASHNLFI
ncbi:Sulfurtransferase TusA [compost metagenome]